MDKEYSRGYAVVGGKKVVRVWCRTRMDDGLLLVWKPVGLRERMDVIVFPLVIEAWKTLVLMLRREHNSMQLGVELRRKDLLKAEKRLSKGLLRLSIAEAQLEELQQEEVEK